MQISRQDSSVNRTDYSNNSVRPAAEQQAPQTQQVQKIQHAQQVFRPGSSDVTQISGESAQNTVPSQERTEHLNALKENVASGDKSKAEAGKDTSEVTKSGEAGKLEPITIKGTDGNDALKISQNEDGSLKVNLNGKESSYKAEEIERLVFDLGQGNNRIAADETVHSDLNISVGDGDNDITGGRGKNTVRAGHGNNKIHGGEGDAVITAGNGNNEITGGKGTNIISAGNGDNRIHGRGQGDNIIMAGKGNNFIEGGEGDDLIMAGNGNNIINGKSGNDMIRMGDGDNVILGGEGDDTITTGNGNNIIFGGAGSNHIKTGSGDNVINEDKGGGAGKTDGGQYPSKIDSTAIDNISDKKTVDFFKKNPAYAEVINKRHENADPAVRAAYEKMESSIKVANGDHSGGAYYTPSQKAVYLNKTKDMKQGDDHNARTYYHEVGHLMDDKMSDKGYLSDNKEFGSALKTDFNNYVQSYMDENNVSRSSALKAIGQSMRGKDYMDFVGASDLAGGLSGGAAQGRFGHSQGYWRGNALNHEAFAHFFEAGMGGTKAQQENLKKMFPTAHAQFMQWIQDYNSSN